MSLYRRMLALLHRPLIKSAAADPYHQTYHDFAHRVNALQHPRILEIGARRGGGGADHRVNYPQAGSYTGFDIRPGEGVDVVGDAHHLSGSFPAASFDAVFAISVFEHLAYPWKVATEINRVLRPSGIVFIATHPAWPAHELPSDFWRFPAGGLARLFNRQTGFEMLRVAEGLPAVMYSLVDDAATRPMHQCVMHMGVAMLAQKTGECDPALRWEMDAEESAGTRDPHGGAQGAA